MKNTWLRSVLGLGAVLLVAGPGLVMAAYDPSYVPKSLVVNGSSNLTVGGSASYSAFVTFTNLQTATLTGAPVVFSAVNGNISVSGNTATGVSAGISAVKGTLLQQGVLVSGTRIVRVAAAP
jgi:hypothetical protein